MEALRCAGRQRAGRPGCRLRSGPVLPRGGSRTAAVLQASPLAPLTARKAGRRAGRWPSRGPNRVRSVPAERRRARLCWSAPWHDRPRRDWAGPLGLGAPGDHRDHTARGGARLDGRPPRRRHGATVGQGKLQPGAPCRPVRDHRPAGHHGPVPGSPFVFDWAKPVPVAFHRLRNPKLDMVGWPWPGRASTSCSPWPWASRCTPDRPSSTRSVLAVDLVDNLMNAVYANVVLACFNMLPILPPGWRAGADRAPAQRLAWRFAQTERYGLLVILGSCFLVPMIAANSATPSILSAGCCCP